MHFWSKIRGRRVQVPYLLGYSQQTPVLHSPLDKSAQFWSKKSEVAEIFPTDPGFTSLWINRCSFGRKSVVAEEKSNIWDFPSLPWFRTPPWSFGAVLIEKIRCGGGEVLYLRFSHSTLISTPPPGKSVHFWSKESVVAEKSNIWDFPSLPWFRNPTWSFGALLIEKVRCDGRELPYLRFSRPTLISTPPPINRSTFDQKNPRWRRRIPIFEIFPLNPN